MKYLYLSIISLLSLLIIILSLWLKHEKTKVSTFENKKYGTYSKYRKFNDDFVLLEGENPKNGFISDSKSAIKYAELLWLQVYGKKIYAQIPFNTCLVGDSIWIVSGTTPENTAGGVLEAMIRKKDGQVIRISVQK